MSKWLECQEPSYMAGKRGTSGTSAGPRGTLGSRLTPDVLVLYEWPEQYHWECWFGSLVRAMYTVAPTLGRFMFNISALGAHETLDEPKVEAWNCDIEVYRWGVPELWNALD